MNINFISGGMLGDFIHNMSIVKNICERKKSKANIYLTDKISIYNGDAWKLGCNKAHTDLKELVMHQPFVNKFEVLPENFIGPLVNLNTWRVGIEKDRMERGYYYRSWSELLSHYYNYQICPTYKWMVVDKIDDDIKDSILIHRSIHRHNPYFDWKAILDIDEKFAFVTSSIDEWEKFPFKNEKIKLMLVESISDMARCISSCKYFIGNQSAPFALASALDIPRLVEMDNSAGVFYMNEAKYSKNISWYLSGKYKYITSACPVKFQ